MAWETRNGQGRYYTRSIRRDGDVVRLYFGNGDVAEAMAQLDALRRDEREATRRAWQAERDDIDAIQADIKSAVGDLDLLMKAELYAAGYHQHKRGEWRRRRVRNH